MKCFECFHKSKPTLVLMAGLPGTGKTTLANKLGQRLHWQVIDKDGIKEQYMLEGFSDDDAARYAYDESFARISTFLTIAKVSVVLDSSAIPEFVWDTAKKIAHTADANVKVLHCAVDNTIRVRRLQEREPRLSQRNTTTYTIQPESSQFIHLPTRTLTVVTNPPLETPLSQILDYVVR
ncbi:MAG TPA: AAA family ATPase [Ktedonobacteraceae bacterium]|nr:AAA family ATPase [Ktedonobacteraceae bacterium]